MQDRVGTINPPELPDSVPSNSQWLSGQGSGTWFCINKTEESNQFRIQRLTPSGDLDCDRIFEIEENGLVFDINEQYVFTHISHCAKCRVTQNGTIFVFNYLEE